VLNKPANDPYRLIPEKQKNPPKGLAGCLSCLGPGLISTASVVGSGELIATTALGAQAGFITLWVIVVSCLVKVTIQLEFGKNAIYGGLPTIASLNRLSGFRIGNGHWTVWSYVLIMGCKFVQYGGIVGGVAIILNIAIPKVPVNVWVIIVALCVSAASYRGIYRWIEKFSIIMVAIFSAFTMICVVMLFFTPYRFSLADISHGLSLSLPIGSVALALSAFGITGMSADEIVLYPYWCIEKGYASFVGPRNDSPEWTRRAHGWIRVMYIDALVSMVIYTTVTLAFYILGAAVLHQWGEVPGGYQIIEVLSRMYTETIGSAGAVIFLIGAFAALASTLLVSVAGWSRIFTDTFARIGILDFDNLNSRKRSILWLSWLFPLIWALLFLFFEVPLLMVTIGGIGTSILLFILVYSALQFRYFRTPKSLRPNYFYDLAFWLSGSAIFGVGIYGLAALT
jgi:Mn2+/Fe2+ NRAMP family transporter